MGAGHFRYGSEGRTLMKPVTGKPKPAGAKPAGAKPKQQASEAQYRKVLLEEFKGKRLFRCECCARMLPVATSLDGHHKYPQLAGVNDARENIAALCVNCHQTLHRIATSMAGIAKTKQPALVSAREYAEVQSPQDIAGTVTRLIEFATLVAQAISLKKNRKIEGGDVDTVLTLKPRLNTLFKHAAKEVKDAHNKPLGKQRLLQVAVIGYLMKQSPSLQQELNDELLEVLGHPPRPKQEPIFMVARRL